MQLFYLNEPSIINIIIISLAQTGIKMNHPTLCSETVFFSCRIYCIESYFCSVSYMLLTQGQRDSGYDIFYYFFLLFLFHVMKIFTHFTKKERKEK